VEDGYLRMGAFSQQVGVSPDLLRAWERRYGLFRPTRSSGGFRLYSDGDAARVRRMLALLDEGLSAAEAARFAAGDGAGAERPAGRSPDLEGGAGGAEPLGTSAAELTARLEGFDDGAAQVLLDDLLARYSVEVVLSAVILPCLAEIGRRWEAGDVSVAQEHFASNLLRGRLLALARGWDRGRGRRVVLAAPPGELHDLGLIAFGLAARPLGWRVTFLGADTPMEALEWAVRRLHPDLVVVAATTPAPLTAVRRRLKTLAGEAPLLLAGPGASATLARAVGAEWTDRDPVDAARSLSEPAD
jgi:MerR family transcriptional regulator, light-induced transcriptional regulator